MAQAMQVYPIQNLTIAIPRYDIVSVEGRIRVYKDTLVYLETLECRKFMTEVQRRQAVKEATENFRAALRMRDISSSVYMDPLYL